MPRARAVCAQLLGDHRVLEACCQLGAHPRSADHEHLAAGNFVFSRGSDHLIVDSSNYGEEGTLETNAIAADADLQVGYTPSQTPWSQDELLWARGTSDAVFAARSDFAKAFIFNGAAAPFPMRIASG